MQNQTIITQASKNYTTKVLALVHVLQTDIHFQIKTGQFGLNNI